MFFYVIPDAKASKFQQFFVSEQLYYIMKQRTNNFIREVQETLKPELSANFIHDVYKFYHSEDLTNHPAIN